MRSFNDYQKMLAMLALSAGKLEVAFVKSKEFTWIIPNNLMIEIMAGTLFFRSIWLQSQYICFDLSKQRVFPLTILQNPHLRTSYQEKTFCILEGASNYERIILISDELPVSDRIRISAVKDVDINTPINPKYCYQMVEIDQQQYAIPDLRTILEECKIPVG